MNCPTCGAPVPWLPASRYRPFCSERCRLIDLGQWAKDGYRIEGEQVDESAAGEAPPPSGDA